MPNTQHNGCPSSQSVTSLCSGRKNFAIADLRIGAVEQFKLQPKTRFEMNESSLSHSYKYLLNEYDERMEMGKLLLSYHLIHLKRSIRILLYFFSYNVRVSVHAFIYKHIWQKNTQWCEVFSVSKIWQLIKHFSRHYCKNIDFPL